MKVHVTASGSPAAQAAALELEGMYDLVPFDEADVVVALGGDGFMLETLHRLIPSNVPVYGMNLGTVGFLMNQYDPAGLLERIERAEPTTLHPLRMETYDAAGSLLGTHLAINDVSLLRESPQTAHVKVSVDGTVRLDELVGDGILVATSAGSTAYNASLMGPIVPLGVGVIALTPISCARPRRWPGALLPAATRIRFDVLDGEKRPVSATADNQMVRGVARVDVALAEEVTLCLLFDEGHNLEERIIREQFVG